MKTRICGLLFAIFAASTVQGDVVVYKKTHRARLVGQGQDLRISSTGFLIVDATTLNGYTISTYNARGDKFFTVAPFEEGIRIYHVEGSASRMHTVWVGSAITNKPAEFHDGVEFGIGTDAELAITPTNSLRLPRILTGVNGGIVIPNGQAGVAQSGTGVASYSQKETRLANSFGESPTNALARYRASLLSQGYRELTP